MGVSCDNDGRLQRTLNIFRQKPDQMLLWRRSKFKFRFCLKVVLLKNLGSVVSVFETRF
jgi:hypothetical protein